MAGLALSKVQVDVPLWLQILAAFGTFVGGPAAALGAFFAFRAAKRSSEVSRYATDALALAIKPELSVRLTNLHRGGEPPEVALELENTSDWDAVDLEVEADTASGRKVREKAQRLPSPRNAEDADEATTYIGLGLREGGYDQGALELEIPLVRVRYSDHRSIARYEKTFHWDYERKEHDGITSYGGRSWAEEDRLK